MINCEAPLDTYMVYKPTKPKIKPTEIPVTYAKDSPEYTLTMKNISQQNVFKNIKPEQHAKISLALGLLNLSGSDTTDEVLRALPTLYPKLKILRLSDCNITNAGLVHLTALPLQTLTIEGCANITQEGVLQLPSKCKVHLTEQVE